MINLIVRQGMRSIWVGALSGLIGAFGLSRVLTGFLYEVNFMGSVLFAVVPLILVGLAAFSCLIPAFRPSKSDLIKALSH